MKKSKPPPFCLFFSWQRRKRVDYAVHSHVGGRIPICIKSMKHLLLLSKLWYVSLHYSSTVATARLLRKWITTDGDVDHTGSITKRKNWETPSNFLNGFFFLKREKHQVETSANFATCDFRSVPISRSWYSPSKSKRNMFFNPIPFEIDLYKR